MSFCCNRPSVPHVILAADRPTEPWNSEVLGSARMSTRLLELPVPPSPVTDLRSDLRLLLNELGNRQEELFSQLLDQQNEVICRLSSMQSASKEDAASRQDFLNEIRKLLPDSQTVDMTNNVANMNTNGQVGMTQFQAQCLWAPTTTLTGYKPQCLDKQMSHKDSANCQSVTPGALTSPGSVSEEAASALKLRDRRTQAAPCDQSLQARIDYWLKSREFECAIALAIILNAAIMCWECQYQGLEVGFSLQFPGREVEARIVWPGAALAFSCFEWLFGLLFLLEMLVKLIFWRLKYFYDSHGEGCSRGGRCSPRQCLSNVQGWNLLDFVNVAAFVVDKLAASAFSDFFQVNPQMLRQLRLLRLCRLVRLLRFLETLDHLYVMTTAIAGLSRVLTWACVLLTLMLLICNLCLVQILHVTYFDHVTASDLSEDSLRKHRQVYEYFGTCTRCMLSMFELTLGNWPPVARLLVEEVSEWFGLICIVHKLAIGFGVIGVITGVILQETFKVAQTDDIIMFRQKKNASRVLAKKMKSLFKTLDMDPDGKLQRSEFAAISDDPDIKTWLASLDIETDDLMVMFELLDMDGSGYITVDELVTRMPRVRGGARSIDVLKLLRKYLLSAEVNALQHQ